MPRPVKCRRIACMPGVTYFKPVGIPMRMLDEVSISVEELEAMRLRDIEKLKQQQCARLMDISRSTYQRVLSSARGKITGAIIKGRAIKIEGGNYKVANLKPDVLSNCKGKE